jgi:uncharacterized protein YndB with AHSA1/START domain
MSQNNVIHDTFVIERTYKSAPERVFEAWADPAQKRRWLVEGEGWTIHSFEMDFKEGGLERSRFRYKDGPDMGNDTIYHDIVQNRRIVTSYSMIVGRERISVSLATVEFVPAGTSTLLRFTEQATFFEGGDGAERRRQGWTFLLERLAAHLSEPANLQPPG